MGGGGAGVFRMLIYTGGTFDLFHASHAGFLKRCWELSGCEHFVGLSAVIVSLNTDEFVQEYKGRPPINTYSERKAVLESCKYVSRVIPNTGGADSREAIEAVKPDVLAVGSDWHHPADYLTQMGLTWEWLRERRIGILYIPRGVETSTTEIKRRMLE
jgi:glycerol-3-phosphate cytidylyltransferase